MQTNPLAEMMQQQQTQVPTPTESGMAQQQPQQPNIDPATGLPQDFMAALAKLHVDYTAKKWADKQAMDKGQQPMPTVADTAGKQAEQIIQQQMVEQYAKNNPAQAQQQPPAQGTGLAAAAQAQAQPQAMAQGGLTSLGSNLPKQYAGGGIIAFSEGGFMPPARPDMSVYEPAPGDTAADRQYKEAKKAAVIKEYYAAVVAAKKEYENNEYQKKLAASLGAANRTIGDPNMGTEGRRAPVDPAPQEQQPYTIAPDYAQKQRDRTTDYNPSAPPQQSTPQPIPAPTPPGPGAYPYARQSSAQTLAQGAIGADPAAARSELAAAVASLRETNNPQDRAHLQEYIASLQQQITAIGASTLPIAQQNPQQQPAQPQQPPSDYEALTREAIADSRAGMGTDPEAARRKAYEEAQEQYLKQYRTDAAEVRGGLRDAYEKRKGERNGWQDIAADIARGFSVRDKNGDVDLGRSIATYVDASDKRLAGYSQDDVAHLSALAGLTKEDAVMGKSSMDYGRAAMEHALGTKERGLASAVSLINAEQLSKDRDETRKGRELQVTENQRIAQENLKQRQKELQAKIDQAKTEEERKRLEIAGKNILYTESKVDSEARALATKDHDKLVKEAATAGSPNYGKKPTVTQNDLYEDYKAKLMLTKAPLLNKWYTELGVEPYTPAPVDFSKI